MNRFEETSWVSKILRSFKSQSHTSAIIFLLLLFFISVIFFILKALNKIETVISHLFKRNNYETFLVGKEQPIGATLATKDENKTDYYFVEGTKMWAYDKSFVSRNYWGVSKLLAFRKLGYV